LTGLGLTATAVTPSRLRGPSGNVEFFMLVTRGGLPFDDGALAAALAGVPA
jgi:hypothetical protein